MAAKTNTLTTSGISVNAREIDFVTRFGRNWDHLRDIIGISRPIKKQPGTMLKAKTATVTLDGTTVGEGEEIPYSKVVINETAYDEITVEKYATAVSLEAIKDYGYDIAVQKSDDEFLAQLQDRVVSKFYTYLNTGTLKSSQSDFQLGLAMAKGQVENKFKGMHRNISGVIGFVNVLDFYKYLGTASITVQNEYGLTYIQNFMGYQAIFLLSDSEVASGTILATAVENIVMYYVDPADSDFAKAGLEYTTTGETAMIGFHTQGNYSTAVSEAFAIMGVALFAEYQDGIAVVTVAGE